MLALASPKDCGRRRAGAQSGFTLVELMVTVIVLGIVVALATPNMSGLLNGSRLTSQANELVAALQMARSEAIKGNRSIDVAVTGTGWSVTRGGETLQTGSFRSPLKVSSTGFPIVFRPNGMATKSGGASITGSSITICSPSRQPAENKRVIDFSGPGRVSVSKSGTAGVC